MTPHTDRRTALAGMLGRVRPGLPGCAAFDDRAADAPLALAEVPSLAPRPRLALVLSSDGPRGDAHIGVLRVLEEAGIAPDLVVGSSVGALIGMFWAAGLSAARIDEMSMQGGPLSVFDPSPFADRGWIQGRRRQDLPRRANVVATRRDDKQPRYFTSGPAGVAVREAGARGAAGHDRLIPIRNPRFGNVRLLSARCGQAQTAEYLHRRVAEDAEQAQRKFNEKKALLSFPA